MKPFAFVIGLILCAGATAGDPPSAKPLAGWLGVFPNVMGYQRHFEQPKAAKETWSQKVRYEWTGGRLETIEVILARDPEFEKTYSATVYQRLAVTPAKVKVGAYDGWLFPAERLILFLAKDRTADLSAPTRKHFESDLVKFAEKLPLAEMARALEKAPRQKFERSLEAFGALRKGMSLDDVTAWIGDADKDIGSGIHIMAYALPDGSQVLIGFPDFSKLIYVKHRDKDGKVTDLVK